MTNAANAVFFTAQLDFQTDASDVRTGSGFVLVDSRSEVAWRQGHIPGAIHLPTAEIAARAGELIDLATPVVTYCWGPGCNGATKAALAFALAGYSVKEMIGGVEYWVREGFTLRTQEGDVAREPDPLTAPAAPLPRLTAAGAAATALTAAGSGAAALSGAATGSGQATGSGAATGSGQAAGSGQATGAVAVGGGVAGPSCGC